MEIKGVITGDIVNSTALDIESKKYLIDSLFDMADELKSLSPLEIAVYRGDSFQLLVERPEEVLLIAILIRAGLRARTSGSSPVLWDARISIGVGDVSYRDENLAVSDGNAFRRSGWGLDEIGKRRLIINTGNRDIDDELDVSTAFADDIITSWTQSQAQIVWYSLLTDEPQKDIASSMGTTVQNVNKHLNAAKESLIMLYLKRFERIIEHNLINIF